MEFLMCGGAGDNQSVSHNDVLVNADPTFSCQTLIAESAGDGVSPTNVHEVEAEDDIDDSDAPKQNSEEHMLNVNDIGTRENADGCPDSKLASGDAATSLGMPCGAKPEERHSTDLESGTSRISQPFSDELPLLEKEPKSAEQDDRNMNGPSAGDGTQLDMVADALLGDLLGEFAEQLSPTEDQTGNAAPSESVGTPSTASSTACIPPQCTDAVSKDTERKRQKGLQGAARRTARRKLPAAVKMNEPCSETFEEVSASTKDSQDIQPSTALPQRSADHAPSPSTLENLEPPNHRKRAWTGESAFECGSSLQFPMAALPDATAVSDGKTCDEQVPTPQGQIEEAKALTGPEPAQVVEAKSDGLGMSSATAEPGHTSYWSFEEKRWDWYRSAQSSPAVTLYFGGSEISPCRPRGSADQTPSLVCSSSQKADSTSESQRRNSGTTSTSQAVAVMQAVAAETKSKSHPSTQGLDPTVVCPPELGVKRPQEEQETLADKKASLQMEVTTEGSELPSSTPSDQKYTELSANKRRKKEWYAQKYAGAGQHDRSVNQRPQSSGGVPSGKGGSGRGRGGSAGRRPQQEKDAFSECRGTTTRGLSSQPPAIYTPLASAASTVKLPWATPGGMLPRVDDILSPLPP